jgi:hypothetical protein
MPRMSKNQRHTTGEVEMWINPNSTFKGTRGWESRAGGTSSNSRYLDLADIALGLKKPEGRKKKTAAARIRSSEKTQH